MLPDYKKFFAILYKMMKLCGINLFDPNFKPNKRTLWIGILFIFVYLSSIYTLIDSWPDMEQEIKCILLFGATIQVSFSDYAHTWLIFYFHNLFSKNSTKYFVLVLKQRKFYKMYIKVRALHENAIHQSEEKQKIVSNCLEMIIKIVLILCTIYVLAVITFWIYPMYTYFYQHKLELMFGMRVPFVNHTTFRGYTITTSLHLILEIYIIILDSCFDSIAMMIFYYTTAFNGFLRVDLHEFGEYLRNQDHNKHEVKEKLNNIILKHQEIIQ